MVECKYYLSINNVIDRSTCYETATEARRAAKSLRAARIMIVVEKFTRAFLEVKKQIGKNKNKIREDRLLMIFMVNDKRIEIYIHEVGKKTKFPVFVTLPPSIIRKVTFLNNEECTTSESNLETILIVAQKTLNLWNEKAEQESENPRYFKLCKVEL